MKLSFLKQILACFEVFLLKASIFIKNQLFRCLFSRVLLNPRNSLLFLAAPCVACFLIYLHKRSHHLVIRIYAFEEVIEIYENIQNIQYFVNVQDLPPSFATKERLSRCSGKAKVMRYPAQVSSNLQSNYFSEQFHMAAPLCVSLTNHQKKEDSCPANNCMFKVNNAKARQVVKCV